MECLGKDIMGEMEDQQVVGQHIARKWL